MKLIYIVPILFIVTSCNRLNNFLKDNPDSYVEECVEDTIENLTGLCIDLTGEDGQKKAENK